MLFSLTHINVLAVIVATLCWSLFGALYFMLLVPKYYVIALGRQNAPAYAPAPSDFVVQIACTLMTILTSAVLARAVHVTSVQEAAVFGGIIGLGYLVPMAFNIAVNPNFPRPIMYGLLNTPFFLLGSVMVNVILVAMG